MWYWVPFKSIHLIKKDIYRTKVKIVGTGVTLHVSNTCRVSSEDFMINVLKHFDVDIVKSALILKDGTPQYIEKYNLGQKYFEVNLNFLVKTMLINKV